MSEQQARTTDHDPSKSASLLIPRLSAWRICGERMLRQRPHKPDAHRPDGYNHWAPRVFDIISSGIHCVSSNNPYKQYRSNDDWEFYPERAADVFAGAVTIRDTELNGRLDKQATIDDIPAFKQSLDSLIQIRPLCTDHMSFFKKSVRDLIESTLDTTIYDYRP